MFSRKTKYALQALALLAQAPAGEPMLIAELAEQERIPRKFLEAILVALRKGGLLHSRVGRGGGYQLAMPAAEIPVARIVEILDGGFASLPCLDPDTPRRCDECRDLVTCAARLVMTDVRQVVTSMLEDISLADVVQRMHAAEMRRRGRVDFSI